MPTINDKLTAEAHNERTVRLYAEAAFYKAYERSAYLFVTQIRPYEARRRHIKAAGGDVVSIGFPQTVLETLDVQSEKQSDGTVLIRLSTALDEQAYQLWRSTVPLFTMPPKAAAVVSQTVEEPASQARPVEQDVAECILHFSLADATPMQCMLLISDLQRKLKAR
ncbi:MAG: hypothetical protein II822_03925 [Prevotella sp.]|nr:hypothetical protein [Prevotella sp.]